MKAVEWFRNQLEFDESVSIDNIEDLLEQAKQMEKQQIIDAFESGLYDGGENLSSYNMDAEQYYNEYFKTE